MTSQDTNKEQQEAGPTLVEQEAWLPAYVTQLTGALSAMPAFVNCDGALDTLKLSRAALASLRKLKDCERYAERGELQHPQEDAVDARRYRRLRGKMRAAFDESSPDEPQIVWRKRSDPYIKGYAERLDAALHSDTGG